jgi:NAD(P)-dependent dehydrogenase (short-subunit alcohol dehydrogenase family)
MKIDLSGKTAVVTGSTGGIGFAIAKGLAEAGATVVLNGRTQDAVDAAMARIAQASPSAAVRGKAADLGTAEGCAALVAAEPQADVLVNNVGVFGPQDFFEIEDETWEYFLAVNVMSGVRLSRAYLPQMIERGWGRVIFMSSESGLNIPVEMIHYGVTKTALLGVSRGFAKEAAGSGVTVNSVIAGPTHTEGVEEFVHSLVGDLPWDEAQREFMRLHRPQSLLQRLIEPEEIANMCVYLASPLASATTGAAVRVDGGYVDSILP